MASPLMASRGARRSGAVRRWEAALGSDGYVASEAFPDLLLLPAGCAPRQLAFGRVEESSGHGFPAVKRRAIFSSPLRLAALAQGRLYGAD
jgi:hypothetical protein